MLAFSAMASEHAAHASDEQAATATGRVAHDIAQAGLPFLTGKTDTPPEQWTSLSNHICWQAVEDCAARAGALPRYKGLSVQDWLQVCSGAISKPGPDGYSISERACVESAAHMRAVPPGHVVLLVDTNVKPTAAGEGSGKPGNFPIKHAMVSTGDGKAAGTNNIEPITMLPLHGGAGSQTIAPGSAWQEADLAAHWDTLHSGEHRAQDRQVAAVPLSALVDWLKKQQPATSNHATTQIDPGLGRRPGRMRRFVRGVKGMFSRG